MNIKNTKEREETLLEVYKQLQEIRYKTHEKKVNKIFNNTIKSKFKIETKNKKQGISLAIILLGVIFIITLTISTNSIFATNSNTQLEKVQIENNNEEIQIEDIIMDNMKTIQIKEMVTENRSIEFKTTYKENENLPKDEQVILQEGIVGNKIVTVLRTYEKVEGRKTLKEENILNTTVTQKPEEQIIEVGTSELLGKFKVHIGDTMYTIADVPLKDSIRANANTICIIGKYVDVKILGVQGEYIRLQYLDNVGYVDSNFLVSQYTNPEYVEKCRIQKILSNVNFEMDVNKPSGLTLEDFKKVLSNNPRDVNKIFENNAEIFYNLEEKYNINGLLIAAMGIHESAWGTSKIANDKQNLFGYGAYDHDAYNSAFIFTEYQEGIETVARALAKNYLNTAGTIIYGGETATGKYYNGTTISSINIRYATDENWANAVYNIMEGLYERLQQ